MASSFDPEQSVTRLKEADAFLSRGLITEATAAYQSLLSEYEGLLAQVPQTDTETRRSINEWIAALRERLAEAEKSPPQAPTASATSSAPKSPDLASDAESIFKSGIALKDIGLYEEAIEEFQRALELRYRTIECYDEIGDARIQMGDFPQGIKHFYDALQQDGLTPVQNSGILEKIASAYREIDEKKNAILRHQDISFAQKATLLEKIAATYEEVKEKHKAAEIYRELNALDKSRSEGVARPQVSVVPRRRLRFSFEAVCNHPRIFLLCSIIFALCFMAFLPYTKTVDNVDYFTPKDDPDVRFYDGFKGVFGNDEFFIIAFEEDDIFTTKNLNLIKNITDQLETLEEVRKVKSLTNVDDTIGAADYFEVTRFLEEIPEDERELQARKNQAVTNPLYARNLISLDARTAAIVVLTYDRPEDDDYRTRLISKVNDILQPYRAAGEKFSLAGWTTTNLSLAQYMKKDVATFIPITYVMITLMIFLFFKSLRLTVLALANISICMGSTMGLLGMTGITLNNVTTIVPPLIMALALSDTVHIFSHMEKRVLEEFPDPRKALASVLNKVVLPCFLTTLTTAIGFLSLVTSSIPPIRDFAYIASAGMLFEFLYSFFFLPPLVLFFSPEKVYLEYQTRKGMTQLLHRLNDFIQGNYRYVIAAGAALVILASSWATQIKVETNLLEYFKSDSPVRNSIAFVEERLGGVGSLDISLQATDKDAFKEPANLTVINQIQAYIQSLPGIDVTTSFCDFIKDMNESFHDEDPAYYTIPDSRKMVSQYLLLYDSEEIEDFINSTYDHARIAARISEHSSAAQAALIDKINEYLETIDHPGLEIRITGRAKQDVNIIDTLVKGQVYSLGLAAAIIAVIMFIVLRSFAIGFLSLIPNLFPIVLNFGIMGAAGIHLNTATALIAAVALGIAVDDTIHFLSEYKVRRAEKATVSDALKLVILTKGRAIFSSSLILCIGFGVLVLSRFVPTVNFGMLSAIIMLTALIGDVVLLPAIISLKK